MNRWVQVFNKGNEGGKYCLFGWTFQLLIRSTVAGKEHRATAKFLHVDGKPNLSKNALFLSVAIFSNLSKEITSMYALKLSL